MSGNVAAERVGWTFKKLAARLKKKSDDDSDDFMVIGIDFGTAYSGAAWATSADMEGDQINAITSWPGTGHEEGKAPTELFYEDGNVTWGYDIPRDAEPIRWFKLLLLRTEDLPPEVLQSEYLIRGRKALRDSGQTAVDLVADYLRLFWAHILETISKARGSLVVETMRLHVVITIPAIWKRYCRESMTEAVKKAGILDARLAGDTILSFAPEPEAAALATFHESGTEVGVGDVYIVCDAGGGTVDLISYEVDDVDPISLSEAVIGTGALCGGIFVDEAFESVCRARLGRRWSSLSPTGIQKIMKDEWEYGIKPQFKVNNPADKEFIVSVPAEAFQGADLNDESRKPYIKNGRIHFSHADIEKSFTAVIPQIAKLVDEQIQTAKKKDKRARGVMLVGGFGSSPYLYEYLQQKYRHKQIDVLQSSGMKPRTAICRGAVLKGFMNVPGGQELNDIQQPNPNSIKIVSTIARVSIGMSYSGRYRKGIHKKQDRVWDEDQGRWEVKGLIRWYLEKGENVSTLKPTRHSFSKIFDRHERDKPACVRCRLYENASDEPPSMVGPGMKESCRISATLCDRIDELDDFVSENGRRWKKARYTVEMVPSGASVDFSVRFRGKKVMSKEVSIQV